jgi:hypothetical protein
VLEASIEASHVALSASTGRPVIGVFQTLSLGNAGQIVPGSVVLAAVRWSAFDGVDAEAPATHPVMRASVVERATAPPARPRDGERMDKVRPPGFLLVYT